MLRTNQGEAKEGLEATAGLPAPQRNLGPQQKDPCLSKLRDLDMKVRGVRKLPNEW